MKKILTTIVLGVTFSFAQAQDYHYSMFSMSPLTLNPALTGNYTGDLRIVNNYRMQWTPIGKPFTTYSFGGDLPLKRRDKRKSSPDFFAVGANFNYDIAGTSKLKNISGYGMFSYNLSLDGVGHTYFSMGGMIGLCQRSLTLTDATWGRQWDGLQYDPTLSTGEITGFQDSFSFFDMGVGTAITTTGNDRFKMSGGVAAFHLNRPRIDFLGQADKLYIKINAFWKAEIALGENSNAWLVPQLEFVKQGPSQMINAGLGAKFRLTERSHYTDFQNEKALTIGGMYRVGDAFAGYIRMDFGGVGVAFNYDLNVSKLATATNGVGALEFMLIYTGLYSSKNTRQEHKSFF